MDPDIDMYKHGDTQNLQMPKGQSNMTTDHVLYIYLCYYESV